MRGGLISRTIYLKMTRRIEIYELEKRVKKDFREITTKGQRCRINNPDERNKKKIDFLMKN